MSVCIINYFRSPVKSFWDLSTKMKLMITTGTFLVLWLLMLLSFSNIFKHQLLGVTINGSKVSEKPKDKLLAGLLTADFDEDSCLSRYQSSLYRKSSPYKPSQYLISKLRSYEKLHKRCGPGTDAYKEAAKNLGHKHENGSRYVGECRYIVWLPMAGLGNRIISLVSVFLYALLTQRVILVDQRKGLTDLFCEPFPGPSWLLPLDFPLMNQIDHFQWGHSHCYGTMLRNHAIKSTALPSYLFLYLMHDYRNRDKMFFCEQDQNLIGKVPWLVVKSNLYFIPSLWLIPSFQSELIKLFPQKDTVFHHLSRYLLHPTNQVWGMVTRSYNAYLARADETLGIQVRVFSTPAGYFQHVMDQILACTQSEKLLPEVAAQEESQVTNITSRSQKLKAVLVTSLFPEYSENLKNMFWGRPSTTGEIIKVYQPSGERVQQTGMKLHDQKALAEIYLLSLTDNIVTTARSTFGYIAHSLGGLKPWILFKPENNTAPDPPCVRAMSMEPCFIRAPLHGCQAKTVKISPFVMHCEDWIPGLKLVDAPNVSSSTTSIVA
uniref:Fucosyltransferase n=2 Tax=Noccaea caerulescens TaxID=107243 RepID=A0A1J3H5B7_NOCCA